MKDLFIFILAFLSSCSLFSCSDENPSPADQGHNSDKGEVSFEISNDGGTGSGTSSSPAEVSMGDTLNMVISQKSSYTDSDGTVFECEPKATIELFAKLDTVYVDDLTKLTNVQEKPEVQTSKEGQDPIVNEINQKFLIGDQYVNFDLAYEVYNYRTVDGKTIEMPYVKLNQANLGNSNATEETKSRSETVVKSITVKPIPQTRASVSDTTWYEVNAVFNLDIECMNAKTENKQNLTFSVTYMGAVTTEIELGEPVKELSSTIEVLGGTNSTSSPFLVNPKEKLSLLFKQNSSYTDSYGNKMSCEPEAEIKLFAQNDTVYAEKKDEIAKTPSTEKTEFTANGENPIQYSATQAIQIGPQNIQLEMLYEIFSATNVENQEIEMPHLKFENVSIGELSINESTTRTITASDTIFYDIQVPIKLDVINVGPEDENRQTLEFVISYIGAVVKEIELSDPIKKLSSTISVLGGTNSTSSPFLANRQDVMSLLFKQNSSYTDSYGNKMSCEPEAKIKIFAQADTIYATKKEELEGIPASHDFVFTASGEDPVLYSAIQLFELGVQHIQLEMSYEVYTAKDIENNEITMPYLKQNATITDAATVSVLSTVTSSKADTTFYEVKVPIKLETIDVETTDENIQTFELVISYIGAVVTLKEVPELVKVEYRTGYVWEEAHHNLPLLYYAKVYRDRYYSNGEVFTDEFVDNGHSADVIASTSTMLSSSQQNYPLEGIAVYDIDDGLTDSIVYKAGEVFENDSIRIIHCSATISGHPKDSKTKQFESDRNNPIGEWDSYLVSKLYDNSLNIDSDIPSQNSYPTSARETGWYFQNVTYSRYLYIYLPNDIRAIFISDLNVNQYDQYLVIDGKRIEFTQYYPECDHKFSTEDIPDGMKFIHECIVKFMGRNFYSSNVMEITQRK